jgi:phosphohistidine swiveling domain-containing protein
MCYITPLDDPTLDLARAGGKGASLARLAQAGFAAYVPPGFVVTTDAYRAFVLANDLSAVIAALSAQTQAGDPASFERASEAIRARFAAGAVPPDVAAALTGAYRGGPVAVRSSATAEDLPEASFAGQQETYLNVQGPEALLDAVHRCWSSLWTARALAYRARQGIAPDAVSLAVVVQALAPAEAAGILFTVNPVNGARDEIVINAAWGLGEAVVGGQVNPDTFVVDKTSGALKATVLGDKSVMTATTAGGTATVDVAAERRHAAALTPAQATALARLGAAVERAFGGPQDVEWAVAGDRLYLLQARPVTAIAGVPAGGSALPGDDDWPPLDDGVVRPYDFWTQADVGERWPEPVTPLSWSSTPWTVSINLRHSLREVRKPYLREIRWARRAYGRVYFNEGALMHVMVEEFGLPRGSAAASMGGRVTDDGRAPGAAPGAMLRRVPLFAEFMFHRLSSERKLAREFAVIDRWMDEFRARDLSVPSDRELWDEVQTVWQSRAVALINLYADLTALATTAIPQLEGLVATLKARKELAADLVTGLSGLYTAQMVPMLWRIGRTLQELGLERVVTEQEPDAALAELRRRPEAGPVLAQLDAFLREHGHRCASELEFLYPRWAEAPGAVIDALAGQLRMGLPLDPSAAEARQRRAREAAQAEVERKLNPLSKAYFRMMLARAQHVLRLRDNAQHFIAKLVLPMRRLYATLAERWAARGWLDDMTDFFFLVPGDIDAVVHAGSPQAAGLDLRAVAGARRRAYEYWLQHPAPEVLGADGRPPAPDAAAAPDGSVLAGFAGSGGRVRGTARLIAHPREAVRLQRGDILVTRSTDPGWTPVFPLVSALVLEVGGQLSHGAIVAREYGIPAVLNVSDATRLIRDGQTIVVDGSEGRVYLEA